jgi:histidinol-phosphatase (PHP family)
MTRNTDTALPIVADVHMHTSHSHGQNTTAEMFRAAKGKGLKIIGFSEHSPRPEGYAYPMDYQAALVAGFPDYVREVQDIAQAAKGDGLEVALGLEVDYIPGQEAFADALRKAHPFDYIIGGLHFQGSWGFDFAASDWDAMDREARYRAYARYYDDLAAMCRTGMFHIAAHPDLIKIFSVETFREWLDTPEAMPLVRKALSAMKDSGVIMEISSAGLRKPCQEIYPGPRIMQVAAELELPVSFASDAHCVNTPAYAFDALARYAASFGFDHSHVVIAGQRRSVPFQAPPVL